MAIGSAGHEPFAWWLSWLNRKLLRYANQNVTAAFAFVQKLNQAKNLEDVVQIQTEFMNTQLSVFNKQAKNIGEKYAKALECVFVSASAAFKTAEAATKMYSLMSTD